jgi:NTP pyrophosphatase (non-canonical NTP hydrolase)
MTEAERERLAMLAEEAGEIVQIVGKILRHGYESYHPDDPLKVTNRQHLTNELQDIDGVVYGMVSNGDLQISDFSLEKAIATWQRKLKWTHHQEISYD